LKTCPECEHKRPVFGLSTIKGKWVYILMESGGALNPHLEIEIKDSSSGSIHPFKNGHFTDEKVVPFDGQLVLDKIKDHTWHFFLSPIRLGRQALSLLTQAPKQDPKNAKNRDELKPTDWKVYVMPELELQPWTTTVKRKFPFHSGQFQPPYEYIPLVDAFSWVAQIAELDYLPIVAAQQKLIQDPEEQAKAFVASTLAQAIAKARDPDDPSKFVDDQWSIKDVTLGTPGDLQSKANNIAEAWVYRYKAALEFLTTEANQACSRVCFPVRFSLGHRIVELACQENTTDPTFLGFGMTHWAHILREMQISPAGRAFTVWIAKNKDAADRIPQRTVLGDNGLQALSNMTLEDRISLPVHVLAYLAPVLIASSDKPAEDMSKRLSKIGVNAKTFGPKDLKAMQDLSLKLPDMILDHYIKKLPAEINPWAEDADKQFHTASGLTTWKARIQSFSTIRDVELIVSLFSDLTEFAQKKEGVHRTDWDRFKDAKKKVETGVKVAEYLTEKTHTLIKQGITSQKGYFSLEDLSFEEKLAKKIEEEGTRVLGSIEAEIVSASRSLRAFKLVGVGKRVLAGPVGLIIGGCEIAIQFHEMGEAWEAGDPGKAVGLGIQVMGGALIIFVAAAETVALISGAGALAWAGPVGWIAAALIIIGTIIEIYSSKNDLQLFAQHCFLGPDWGEGGSETTGKAWMGTMGWSELKSATKTRLALLHMLTGFTTWTGWWKTPQAPLTTTGPGGFILPAYVPANAFFEVEVDWAPRDQEPSKMLGYKAIIWPMEGDFTWLGKEPPRKEIRIERNESQITLIRIAASPHLSDPIDWNFRVRLVYDSSASNTLPIEGWVENKSVDQSMGYNQVSSG
jgi:hypothetical protein